MAGKDVGASQDNRFFAGGNMEFFAGFIGRKMLLKQGAEPGDSPSDARIWPCSLMICMESPTHS